jgi:hypothetical protein
MAGADDDYIELFRELHFRGGQRPPSESCLFLLSF